MQAWPVTKAFIERYCMLAVILILATQEVELVLLFLTSQINRLGVWAQVVSGRAEKRQTERSAQQVRCQQSGWTGEPA